MRGILLAGVVALVLAGSARAASIQDLKSLGYTVKVVSQSLTCKEWAASGFGISKRLGCEGTSSFQASLDAMADPETACDVKWQYNHHDQRSAVSQLGQLGYAVTADECAGAYTVTDRYSKAVVYKGNGAGLVSLAARLQAAAPGGTSLPALSSTCLPLCTDVVPTTVRSSQISKTKVSLAVDISLADVEPRAPEARPCVGQPVALLCDQRCARAQAPRDQPDRLHDPREPPGLLTALQSDLPDPGDRHVLRDERRGDRASVAEDREQPLDRLD